MMDMVEIVWFAASHLADLAARSTFIPFITPDIRRSLGADIRRMLSDRVTIPTCCGRSRGSRSTPPEEPREPFVLGGLACSTAAIKVSRIPE